MLTNSVSQINGFISRQRGKVNAQFRQKFHMMPPVGWMNDPNGLIKFNGKYHLYYQFNPYASTPGTMLWGHFISDDLISYADGGAAIVPSTEHVSIFSGGAIQYEGRIAAVFTEHYENGDERREEIYMALSDDGMNFYGRKKIFDNESLPAELSRSDFRDPCPVRTGDYYYVFVGGKLVKENKGVIVVLGGSTLERLSYKFTIGPFYELGDMGECPCYRRIDGKDVIIASACNVPARGNDFSNVNSSVFILGEIDFVNGSMKVENIREIDKGDAFYAPQLINGDDRPVMIAWHEMWGKPYPTGDMNHGWAGCFTIPRTLSVRGDEVYQSPVEELEKYLVGYEGDGVPACADIRFEFGGDGEVVLSGDDGSVALGCRDGAVYLDTRLSNNKNGCVRRTNYVYDRAEVRVLSDVSGIEVFVDGGRETISSRLYISGKLTLSAKGCVSKPQIKQVQI